VYHRSQVAIRCFSILQTNAEHAGVPNRSSVVASKYVERENRRTPRRTEPEIRRTPLKTSVYYMIAVLALCARITMAACHIVRAYGNVAARLRSGERGNDTTGLKSRCRPGEQNDASRELDCLIKRQCLEPVHLNNFKSLFSFYCA